MLNLLIASKKLGLKARLWTKSSEFDEAWKERISLMASYISVPGTVADLGCGMMWLEPLLKPQNAYFPVDYVRRDDRTLDVDFNAGPLPAIPAQVAFLSGSLEYVRNVPAFVDELISRRFDQIIFSYCTVEKFPSLKARRCLNWVSHESIFSLLRLFSRGYDLAGIDDVQENTVFVFRLKKP